MNNFIGNIISPQAKSIHGKPSGIGHNQNDLASPDATFVDFIMARLTAMNISKGELSNIEKDLSNGQIQQESPLFNLIGQISKEFNIHNKVEINNGDYNALFKELAGLLISLDASDQIELPETISKELVQINKGLIEPENLINLIQTGELSNILQTLPKTEQASMTKSASKEMDKSDYIALRELGLITQNSQHADKDGFDIIINELTHILQQIDQKASLSSDAYPSDQKSLSVLHENITALIQQMKSSHPQNSVETTSVLEDGKNVIPQHDIAVKTQKGKRSAPLQTQNIDVKTAQSNTIKKNTNAQLSSSFNINNDSHTWLNPTESEIHFDPKNELKTIITDTVQNNIRTGKSSMMQSNARNLLPPNPIAQQVMVHIQKNAGQQSRMNIQLNPSELGRVEVRLTVENDGRTTAKILADRPETLKLLQKDSVHLEKALQNAGLNLGSQDLSFNLRDGQNGEEFNKHKRFSRRNRSTNTSSTIEGVTLSTDQINANIFGRYSVNYKA